MPRLELGEAQDERSCAKTKAGQKSQVRFKARQGVRRLLCCQDNGATGRESDDGADRGGDF